MGKEHCQGAVSQKGLRTNHQKAMHSKCVDEGELRVDNFVSW